MSLLFGNLTQDFVSFANASNNINSNDPDSTAKLDQAAANFRHIAAKDASYLTYIGPSLTSPLFPGSKPSIVIVQAWARSFAHTHICVSGSLPQKRLLSEFANFISKQFYGRTLPSLITSVLARSLLAFRQTPVRGSFSPVSTR